MVDMKLHYTDKCNTHVWTIFFENSFNTKTIDYDPVHSMHGMYEHCKNMVK